MCINAIWYLLHYISLITTSNLSESILYIVSDESAQTNDSLSTSMLLEPNKL